MASSTNLNPAVLCRCKYNFNIGIFTAADDDDGDYTDDDHNDDDDASDDNDGHGDVKV